MEGGGRATMDGGLRDGLFVEFISGNIVIGGQKSPIAGQRCFITKDSVEPTAWEKIKGVGRGRFFDNDKLKIGKYLSFASINIYHTLMGGVKDEYLHVIQAIRAYENEMITKTTI